MVRSGSATELTELDECSAPLITAVKSMRHSASTDKLDRLEGGNLETQRSFSFDEHEEADDRGRLYSVGLSAGQCRFALAGPPLEQSVMRAWIGVCVRMSTECVCAYIHAIHACMHRHICSTCLQCMHTCGACVRGHMHAALASRHARK